MNTETSRLVEIDVVKTSLQKSFFSVFSFDSPDELIAAIDGIDVDVRSLSRCRDIRYSLADGWVYWFLFAKGYLQYRKAGGVEPGNVYLDYLVEYFLAHGHNPAMRQDLEDHERAAERVARRYRDFDNLAGVDSAGAAEVVNPIRVTVSHPPSPHPYFFFPSHGENPIIVRAIDGWHRMCSARLSGVRVLPCEVVDEDLDSKTIDSTVDVFTWEDGRILVSGWWLHPELPIYNYELRLRGHTLATGTPLSRPDIKAARPDIPHAEYSGFAIDCPCNSAHDSADLVLVGMQDIIPVGVVPLTPAQSGFAGAARETANAGRT
jgi:hypothetical protein